MLLTLLVLGAVLHLFRLSDPPRLVFDEVHFGGFVNAYCCSGRYFFDIHPPHGKLLIAGVAALGGYRGDQAFEALNEPATEVSPALFRLIPALFGVLIPAILFGLLLQLGASPVASFLGGLAALLDNALLVQTRIIALDGILLAALFGALSCLLAAMRCEDRLRRTGWALSAGVLAGLGAGTKFTGLAALALIGACLAVEVVRGRSLARLRRALSQAVWILSGALAVYATGWLLHFWLLPNPGPGYVWGAPSGDVLADTIRVHQSMLASNYGLTAGHPYASPWWSWPWMARPVFYWRSSEAAIYFLGNPAVWWGSALGLLVVTANLGLLRVTNLSLPGAAKPWPAQLWIPLVGYVISFAPLVPVPRPLFLYHYLTPLLFSLCFVLLWLDHAGWTRRGNFRSQRVSVHAAVALLAVGFLAVAPFTFSFVEAPAYRHLLFELFPGWR